jgi:WD40 repeat protein
MPYQVGASLSPNTLSYVVRQADRDLYNALEAGEFCYVFNSRQMGKSSLRVRTTQRLIAERVNCVFLDLTLIGSQNLTLEQWYYTLVKNIVDSCNMPFNLSNWWRDPNRESLSPLGRFGEFIEQVLLTQITGDIVIFIDEIDSVLSLEFPVDDFFAFIRACYNLRADKPKYERLAFVLLGVATPSDLIQDKQRTPFNIARSIELHGFQIQETDSLAKGLEGKASNPKAVLKEILSWTGGQPFLTQKLCKLVLTTFEQIPEAREVELVKELVRSHVIENWENRDEPQHLRTIRDRILHSRRNTAQLLGLYRQILQQRGVLADDSPEQMELRLSGLVVQKGGKLRVYNPIYESVFDREWVEDELARLCPQPYSESLTAWLASDKQDESRLLRGQALADAWKWAEGKDLSKDDYEFLSTSARAQLKQEKRQRKAKAIAAVVVTLFAGTTAIYFFREQNLSLQSQVKLLVTESSSQLEENQLTALVASLKASRKLEKIVWPNQDRKLRDEVVTVLQRSVDVVQEYNRLEGNNDWIQDAHFSPDGKRIATASDNNTIKIFKRDGTLLNTLKGHSNRVYSISFSPDGKTLASASRDRTIKIWDRNGTLKKTLLGHNKWVRSVSFSPDGKVLASASFDKTIKLWEKNGTLLKTLKGHDKEVESVTFSPDGKILASSSADKTIKLWNPQNGELLRTLAGHKGWVIGINFSPDGKILASSSADKTIKLWNPQNGELLRTLTGHSDRVNSISFSPDGKTLASGSYDKTVKLWNLDAVLLATLKGHSRAVTKVSFSLDGKTLASASWDRSVKLWNLDRDLIPILQGHTASIRSVSFSPDGELLVTGSDDGTAKLWKANGTLIRELKGHDEVPIRKIAFSPDSKLIASASDDETINLWNRDGALRKTLTGHTSRVYGLSFSPDKKLLASAGDDGTVRLWKSDGSPFNKPFKAHDAFVVDVNFSPDSKLIATASDDRTARLWNFDGTCVKRLDGCLTLPHDDEVNSVSFSPDGKSILTASDDKTVKLWNREGSLLKTLKGHTDRVMTARFSRDSQIIASASFDGTIKLWKLDGTLLRTLKGHDDFVWEVSFSPDSATLASSSSDKTIRLWRVQGNSTESSDIEKLQKQACDRVRDYLKTNPNISEDDRRLCDGI